MNLVIEYSVAHKCADQLLPIVGKIMQESGIQSGIHFTPRKLARSRLGPVLQMMFEEY